MRIVAGILVGALIARWLYVKGASKIVDQIEEKRDAIQGEMTNEWAARNVDVWKN